MHLADDTIQWSFSTAVQESGHWQFDFVLVGRDGQRVTATWAGDITLPAPDDVVTTPDTVVIGDAQHAVRTLAVAPDSVLFATDPGLAPGQIIVSDVSEGAPEGFLRRVVAVEATDDGWLVATSPATLEDVFLQVDFELDPDAPPTEIETIVHRDEPEQVPDGVVTKSEWRQVPLAALDIAPFPGRPCRAGRRRGHSRAASDDRRHGDPHDRADGRQHHQGRSFRGVDVRGGLPPDYEAHHLMEWQTNEERTVMDLKLKEALPTWMGVSISEVTLRSGEAATFTVTHIPGGGSVTPASLTMDEFQPPCG